MEPIRWRNTICRKGGGLVTARCEPYERVTLVSTHRQILDLLNDGIPICRDCGQDMNPHLETGLLETAHELLQIARVLAERFNTNNGGLKLGPIAQRAYRNQLLHIIAKVGDPDDELAADYVKNTKSFRATANLSDERGKAVQS